MIRYLASPPRRPEGRVAAVFDQMRREFGVLAEALTLHHPIPELLAVTWACLRETVLAPGHLPRSTKEAMALAISRANACPYCVDAHGMMLHALGAGGTESRLVEGEAPQDEGVAELTAWAASTSSSSSATAAPFTDAERPEAVATMCCFQYINRLATALLGPSPLPAPLRWFRSPAVRLVGRALAGTAGRVPEPGEALDLVPATLSRDTDRWDHLGWTDGHPRIAAAFATFAEATDRAVAPVLGPESQAAIRQALAEARGQEPPLGRNWLETRPGGEAERPAIHLALLLARAPHRITRADVQAFLQALPEGHPADPALLGLLSWSGHEAAKEITQRRALSPT